MHFVAASMQYSTFSIPTACPKTRGAFGQGSHYLAQPVSDDVRHKKKKEKTRRMMPIHSTTNYTHSKGYNPPQANTPTQSKTQTTPPPLQRQQWVLL